MQRTTFFSRQRILESTIDELVRQRDALIVENAALKRDNSDLRCFLVRVDRNIRPDVESDWSVFYAGS